MKRQYEISDRDAPAMHHAPVAPALAGLPKEILEPMLAGAWARGIADAYEMMGLGAVLLSGNGRVLHASPRARVLMQNSISIVSDHMVGATPQANEAIERVIEQGLPPASEGSAKIAIESATGRRIIVRTVSVPPAQNQVVQLLKAVFVISEG